MNKEYLKYIGILNEGERISEQQSSELLEINDFYSSELLTIIHYDVVDCVNRKDDEFPTLSVNERECRNTIQVNHEKKFIQCENCGKKSNLEDKEPYTERRVRINDEHLEEVISIVLEKHDFKSTETSSWVRTDLKIDFISRKLISIPLTFVSDKVGYLLNECKNTDIEFWYQNVWKFLFSSDEQKVSWFDGIEATFDKSTFPTDNEIEIYLNKNLDGKHYTVFEKWYSDFLNKVGEKAERFKFAINHLKQTRNSLLGALTVRVGEDLEADTKTFPKVEYYETILRSIQVGDTKLYSEESQVKLTHFRQLLDYVDQEKGAIISLSDDVASSVWSRIFYYKEKRGKWDFIVITRTMLKELISLFAPSLIDN